MNTKHLVLLMFLIIIFILSYIYWKVDTQEERSKLTGYVSMLAIVGTFVLLLSFLDSNESKLLTDKKDILNNTISNDQNGIVDIEKIFIDSSPQLRRLYKQMYPENSVLQALPDPQITPEVLEKEQHMLSIIMQNIESIIYPITMKWLNSNTEFYKTWISTFKMWFSSQLLRDYYQQNKTLYFKETQNFIDSKIL